MKRTLAVIGLLGFAALFMAARPGTEQQLVQQLNGQPVRWILPDAGRSGVFTEYDAGVTNNFACMPLPTTGNPSAARVVGPQRTLVNVVPNVLVVTALTPTNLCIRPAANSPFWDGGCNTLIRDENFGVPLAVGVPQYITPDSTATTICAVSDAGVIVVPIWWAQ